MSTQVLQEEQRTLMIEVNGTGFEDTVGKLFQAMRKKAFVEVGKPIVQMNAKEVYFEDVKLTEKKEKFLFFFMPRTKELYTIKARIVVEVKYINYKKEEFKCLK